MNSNRALETAIQLASVAVIVLFAFWTFAPFAMVVIWAAVIAITFNSVFGLLKKGVGGSGKLAMAIFVVLLLAVVIVPVGWLADSFLDAGRDLRAQAEAGTLVVPPPTEKVKDWPVIGDRTYDLWQSASVNLQATAQKMEPQLRAIARKIASSVGSVTRSLVQTVLAILIAGILLMNAEAIAGGARRIARRLGGAQGEELAVLAVATVRSVVKGVVLVALIQGGLAAAGLALAGVPFVGLWALAVTILAVAQLPPLLVLGPIIPWVFAHQDSTAIAIVYTVWSVLVSGSDPFLKMMLLGRGMNVPMPVILIGAIGGMLRAGMVGLFVGPVVLAIFHQLFVAWLQQGERARAAAKAD